MDEVEAYNQMARSQAAHRQADKAFEKAELLEMKIDFLMKELGLKDKFEKSAKYKRYLSKKN